MPTWDDVVDPVELDELIEEAWRTHAPKRLIAEHDQGV
jgi:hypothetical protein